MRKRLVLSIILWVFVEFSFFCHSTASLAAPSGAKTLRNGYKNMSSPILTSTQQCLARNSGPALHLRWLISSGKLPKINPTRPIPSALFGTLPRIVVSSLANTMTSILWGQKSKHRRLTILVSGLSALGATSQSSYNGSGYTPNVLLCSFQSTE